MLDWLGCELRVFKDFEFWVMNFVFCYIVVVVIEVISNMVICLLMMLIMSELVRLIERKDCFFWREKKIIDKIFFNLCDIYLKYIFYKRE